ncbi:outer membrane protein assembly factor BamE [uncultured Croceicoccus sp.]|uniref:outer membrane protein assembly factor BamE n=1 Tax=uncultured Croceicoccus sp. TaxID=1295329 RepID=UPI0026195513|nr:outer membrane protein assembly factor BamE [uncultured Croceicoccus sp.]
MNFTSGTASRRSIAGRMASRALVLALVAPAMLGGCTAIRDRRGYVGDVALTQSIQPGIDNARSVEGTLGRPSFTSQFGDNTWYYVTSAQQREIFGGSHIVEHRVLRVRFDPSGNVLGVDNTGMDLVRDINPDNKTTPTLGRDRGFFEDLFGNIGSVGAGGLPGAGPGAGGGPP